MDGEQVCHPDYLSLPNEISDAILGRLPIKDAARTSILSKKWRFKWHTMSRLRFDNSCLPPCSQSSIYEQEFRLNKLVRIVDSVLTVHVGPIQCFELAARLPWCPDVDRWILYLKRNHIEEIVLVFSGDVPYRVPETLFHCEGLTCLKLGNCVLGLVGSFVKFRNLKNLSLSNVADPGGRLGELISSCPYMELLHLYYIIGSYQLRVHAPNLKEIIIFDIYCDIIVDPAPHVAKALFSWGRAPTQQDLDHGGKINISKVLGSFPNMESLRLGGFCLKSLHGDGSISNALPPLFGCLKKLFLVVDFTAEEDLLAALCLVRSTPALEALEILVATTSTTTNYWELGDVNVTFNELTTVKMTDITGAPRELELIKGILLKAPVLQSITISLQVGKTMLDYYRISKELMRYRRASQLAEIIFTDQIEYVYV